jgi:type 1 fimbria pilin
MKKMLLSLSVIVMTALTLSGTAHSTDLTVNFTANLRETTCDMKLVGGSGSNTEQTLKIGDSQGKIRLDQVQAGTATAEFKLAIVECPSSLSDLKTTVKGTQNTDLLTGVSNSKTTASGGADYAAVTIARASAPDAPFTINSKRLVWSAAEITSKEIPLVATLKETQTGKMTTGDFEAIVTFEFSYE